MSHSDSVSKSGDGLELVKYSHQGRSPKCKSVAQLAAFCVAAYENLQTRPKPSLSIFVKYTMAPKYCVRSHSLWTAVLRVLNRQRDVLRKIHGNCSLTEIEELEIVGIAIAFASMSCPLLPSDIIQTARNICANKRSPHKLTDGWGWWRRFRKRHENVIRVLRVKGSSFGNSPFLFPHSHFEKLLHHSNLLYE